MALISFDIKQTTPADAKAAMNPLVDFAEKCVITMGNWDKTLIFDNLKKAAEAGIDNLYKQTHGPLVVGATSVTDAAGAATWLAGFSGVSQATQDFVKANPLVVDKMRAERRPLRPWFSHDEQQAMLAGVGGVDWVALLLQIAPILVKILLSLFL